MKSEKIELSNLPPDAQFYKNFGFTTERLPKEEIEDRFGLSDAVRVEFID